MGSPEVLTPYADLDVVLGELVAAWRQILRENLAGAWVQGSFALGGGDRHSDCDWLVATHAPLTEGEVSGLRDLHGGLPDRDGHWWGELEGSYAPLAELASVAGLGRAWLFNDHGHRTLTWDDHCNRAFTRWILREHGITLTGPEPRSVMAAVPTDVLRAEARASLPTFLADLATWTDLDAVDWAQRYAVATTCRVLYTAETGRVASKPGALEWALRTLEPRWRPLLGQVRDERDLGWDPARPPRPGQSDATRQFVAHAVARVSSSNPR